MRCIVWNGRPSRAGHGIAHLRTSAPLDAHDATAFTVAVPMFYRVAMITSEPPQGMVWIDSGEYVMGDTSTVGATNEWPARTNFISGVWMDEMAGNVWKWCWDRYSAYPTGRAGRSARPGNRIR